VVIAARQYAVQTLGLNAGESFTTFSPLSRDTLVLVLSAARRDTLLAHTWWFPVVGRVPYKGFFDFGQARKAAGDMREGGLDTYLRPAPAFSTLGWFNDPLLSTTLRQDTLNLAQTVIHELVHNTLFVKGEVEFNESLASFVGSRGAAAFFRARGQEGAARRVEREWADDKLLGTFWATTARKIDSVFAIPGRDSLTRVRSSDSVYARMRRVLLEDLAPHMPTVPRAGLERIQLDNASLLARQVYASDLWLFDEVHHRLGGSLRETIDRIQAVAAAAEDPFAALRALATSPR
jgi:predicted aminopeptidase